MNTKIWKVSRCGTRGEFEKSITCRQRNTQVRSLKPRADVTKSPKTGKSVAPQDRLMPFKNFLNNPKLLSHLPVYGRLLRCLLGGVALGIPIGIQVLVDRHFTLKGGVILTTVRRRVAKLLSQQVLFFHKHRLCFYAADPRKTIHTSLTTLNYPKHGQETNVKKSETFNNCCHPIALIYITNKLPSKKFYIIYTSRNSTWTRDNLSQTVLKEKKWKVFLK